MNREYGFEGTVQFSKTLAGFLCCCAVEVFFTIGFCVDDKTSPALIIGVTAHCLSWIILGYKISILFKINDCIFYIDTASWAYFLFDFIAYGLLTVSEFSESRTLWNLIAAISHFLIGLVVILFSLVFSSSTGEKKISDRYNMAPRTSKLHCKCLRSIFGERKTRYSFEPPDVKSHFSLDSETRSWWSDIIENDNPTTEPLLIDNDDNYSTSHQSSVLSALEKRLRGDDSLLFENGNELGYDQGQSVSLKESPPVMTDVLQRALDRRKIKVLSPVAGETLTSGISTDDATLIPQGLSVIFSGGNTQEFSVIIHRWALLREVVRLKSVSSQERIAAEMGSILSTKSNSPAPGIPATRSRVHSADSDTIITENIVSVIDIESGGSIHESFHKQQQRRKYSRDSGRMGGSFSSVPPISADDPNTQTMAQVEFEICIRGGPCAEMEWWGRSKGVESSSNRWTVWRTASQVEELHSEMVRE